MSETSYLAKNLEFLMNKQGLNANSLQDKSGITQSTTSRILNGSTKNPRDNVLQQYVDFFGVSVSDLRYKDLAGQGNMTAKPVFDPTKLDGYARIDDWDDNTPLEGDEVAIPFYKDLSFACGHGAEGEARDDEWRKLRFSRMTLERMGVYKDRTFAATATDDSMLPTICDGDTIFVDENRTRIKDGKIFAVEHGGLFYCKRLYNLPNGGVRIVSDNEAQFPERSLSRDEIDYENFRVIGWVYSISRLERW
ncbi:LexA family transcriptional regulator [Moraxella bovis]|uniref:Helix-turn-helix transcriptional regulator n=1 Tax=Moraxella bovis TaxID=476 RepID=A0ABY6M2X0_MORBO|nr:helix-turn-helix transcriptional regulator [Moraxella bovis]UZA02065.1 helix-turn-helix transcriptional regulator [Moraxella bovis]UZA18310.1 helix-turn-helix transcriptional regulator [Moraxella bovis]UZA36496.1 helix-turn-helix transcriptional regulator [Moraxella bovis]